MPPVSLRVPSPLVELVDGRLSAHGVRLYLKRDDLISPELPGNKWRKLKYNIAEARRRDATTLLTFGGAYSNHIRAVAAAGHHFGFRTIGVIRGEEHLPLNESLAFAVGRGMTLTYLDRTRYRAKTDPALIGGLRGRFGDFYLIPEGGSNALAVPGCAELVRELDVDFDVICCPCGTGGTLAGIASALGPGQRALGFSALKGSSRFLNHDVSALQGSVLGRVTPNWSINHDFHFGGFARRTPELDSFIDTFGAEHGITLERIYVAKMLYGIYALTNRAAFPNPTTIVAVITG